jgi:hypothetical protein
MVRVVAFERDEMPGENPISLQNHSSETWFRNVRQGDSDAADERG